MRTLWILRHAKAAPHSPRDHGRPLAARGRRQTTELAAHLQGLASRPSLVLSSSATRALETAQGVLEALGEEAELVVAPALYEADADEVIDIVRRTDDERTDLMVVGHNPTFLELAQLVLGPDDTEGRRQLQSGLPTGALTVTDFDVDRWAKVSAGGGQLVELFVPRAR
ncbi:MAG TPA: histidine phosphatase family protein [Acidimicrobiales bacterium]|nr:histidine phosphatase family protein [Acidimicrobiales bacterium]